MSLEVILSIVLRVLVKFENLSYMILKKKKEPHFSFYQ